MRKYFYRLMTDQDQSPMAEIVKGGLYVFSLIYGLGIQTILGCYKTGLFKKERLFKPVISVGNITWGGTGKTPLVEWLVRYLKEKKSKPAVLIRGYMVKNSRPFWCHCERFLRSNLFKSEIVVRHAHHPSNHPERSRRTSSLKNTPCLPDRQARNDTSDEAQVLHQSFPDVPVLVGKDRIENARRALKEHPVDVLVLDDGFQHWKLDRNLDIVVIDSMNPFGNGHMIPRGILREPLTSLARADVFVLTKTDWAKENIETIKKQLSSLNPKASIVEAVHRPTALLDLSNPSVSESLESLKGKKIAAFCGIGQPESFKHLLKSLGVDVVVFKSFGDHHTYDEKDVSALLDVCRGEKIQTILTTQKDAVKLTRHSEQSPKGEVKPCLPAGRNLMHEEILRFAPRPASHESRGGQDDGKKNRLFSVKMDIQITKGYEEFCGRISRLLGC